MTETYNWIIALFLVLSLVAIHAIGERNYDNGGARALDMGDPVVTYWAGPGFPGNPALTESSLLQLKEGGFNTVWATKPAEMDLAAKFGMRVLYVQSEFAKCLSTNPAERAKAEREIDRVKDHPALLAYMLRDEPPAGEFATLARIKKWGLTRDSKHPMWVNLLPTYANNRQLGVEGDVIRAYWEHVRLFGEVFRPDFITYDHYQFFNNGDAPNYLLNLGIIRQSAAAQGIPFWNGVQACTWVPSGLASPSAPRIPGPDEMRYLVYTTAAYGAQGIYYYVYYWRGHDGSIASTNGVPDEKYFALKTLNREFINIARELKPLRFQGAYLQGLHAPGTTPWCDQALVDISPATPSAELEPMQELEDTTLVTRFDAPGLPTHLMVVNLDYRKDRTLQLKAPAPFEHFDALEGKWSAVGDSQLSLTLVRGGGVLLRLVP